MNFLGFHIGILAFIYLGVPIFKGIPKAIYFQPIMDNIHLKLAYCKASLLSFAGRIQGNKSILHSMLIYFITIYYWQISMLKDLKKHIRNFTSSGNMNKRKVLTIVWKTMCSPIASGSLELRSLLLLKEAINIKIGWDLLNSSS